MASARRWLAGINAALIATVVVYTWFNISVLVPVESSPRKRVKHAARVLMALGWAILAGLLAYMSTRRKPNALDFDWKDRAPLAIAFLHGAATTLALRQNGNTPVYMGALMMTAVFGAMCLASLGLALVLPKDNDDVVAGLIYEGGEEGGISLGESGSAEWSSEGRRVDWPLFFDSPRLRRYRRAAAMAALALLCQPFTLLSASSTLGLIWITAVVLAITPLFLVIRGPRSSEGTDQYYARGKVALVVGTAAAALYSIVPAFTRQRSDGVGFHKYARGVATLAATVLVADVLVYDRRNPPQDAAASNLFDAENDSDQDLEAEGDR